MNEAVELWKEYYRDWMNGYHPAHKDMRRLRREAALERKLAAAQRRIAQLDDKIAESRLIVRHSYIPTLEGNDEVFHVACDEPECRFTATVCIGIHFFCKIHANAN